MSQLYLGEALIRDLLTVACWKDVIDVKLLNFEVHKNIMTVVRSSGNSVRKQMKTSRILKNVFIEFTTCLVRRVSITSVEMLKWMSFTACFILSSDLFE